MPVGVNIHEMPDVDSTTVHFINPEMSHDSQVLGLAAWMIAQDGYKLSTDLAEPEPYVTFYPRMRQDHIERLVEISEAVAAQAGDIPIATHQQGPAEPPRNLLETTASFFD